MQAIDFMNWMDMFSLRGWYWYVKRLSGNDTLLNRTHQAGPYIPREVINTLAPSVMKSTDVNPRKIFHVRVDSHLFEMDVSAIWYNNKTRNECRITNWGGSTSPVLDPESTGSIFILAFHADERSDANEVRVWLCTDIEQEDLVENRIGPIEPGERQFITHTSVGPLSQVTYDGPLKSTSCVLLVQDIPQEWLNAFPSALDIVQKAISLRPAKGKSIDTRLMERKLCEYDIFRSVEKEYVLPRVRGGFTSVEEFLEVANSVANRRKSRAGMSLELQAKAIFDEESIKYSHGAVTELNKRPDFLFPSSEAYQKSTYPYENIFMLAVKTTCKDRWRQILNEADKIEVRHLLTVQEGISENQFKEMQAEGVILVVPESVQEKYTHQIRPHLLSLEGFINKLRRI